MLVEAKPSSLSARCIYSFLAYQVDQPEILLQQYFLHSPTTILLNVLTADVVEVQQGEDGCSEAEESAAAACPGVSLAAV
jgi:hypothetical protein